MKIAVRPTGTERPSGFARVERVRVPHTTGPKPGWRRIAFTPCGFRKSCSSLPTVNSRAATPSSWNSTPAGAFHTPRRASVFAQSPAAMAAGDTITLRGAAGLESGLYLGFADKGHG